MVKCSLKPLVLELSFFEKRSVNIVLREVLAEEAGVANVASTANVASIANAASIANV